MSTPENMPYRRARRVIELDGDSLKPRRDYAAEDLGGVCERTVKRMDLPTTYVAGIAHIAVNAARKVIASRIRQRHQPKKRRGRA